jgi:hypothetical protein
MITNGPSCGNARFKIFVLFRSNKSSRAVLILEERFKRIKMKAVAR